MIARTRSIVLSVAPVTESSHVVTWLTEEHGKLATLIKGAQRPRSLFLGQYDTFYTCELLFYPRPRTGLHIARECTPLKTRAPFRRDWRACAVASYAAGLVARTSQRDTGQREIFALLEGFLDHLQSQGAAIGLVFWFELQLLRLHGLAPSLRACAACGSTRIARAGQVSMQRGGLLCHRCARAEQSAEAIRGDMVALLCAWQEAPTPAAACVTRAHRRQALSVADVLGRFTAYHLETALPGRTTVLDILLPPAGLGTKRP